MMKLLCCRCLTKIEESEFHLFAGNFACEKCVREAWKHYPSATVELEVQTSRRNAPAWLKLHRKAFEKQAAKVADDWRMKA